MRFGALRAMSGIYRLFALLVLLSAVLSGVLTVAGGTAIGGRLGLSGGLLGAMIAVLIGALVALWLLALADAITVLLSIEEHTRLTAELLQEHALAPDPAPSVRRTAAVPTEE